MRNLPPSPSCVYLVLCCHPFPLFLASSPTPSPPPLTSTPPCHFTNPSWLLWIQSNNGHKARFNERGEERGLFNSFDGGLFKKLVSVQSVAGNDKNSEKDAGMVNLCCGAEAALFWSEPEPPLRRRLRRGGAGSGSSSNLIILFDEYQLYLNWSYLRTKKLLKMHPMPVMQIRIRGIRINIWLYPESGSVSIIAGSGIRNRIKLYGSGSIVGHNGS